MDMGQVDEKGRDQWPQNLPSAVPLAPVPRAQLPPAFPFSLAPVCHSWGRRPTCAGLRSPYARDVTAAVSVALAVGR